MTHKIENNTYYIFDDNGAALLKIDLTEKPNNQVVISTNKEVYAGPIDFITFWCNR